MQNGSNEEYVEGEEEEDSAKSVVQVQEETDDETEASALQTEEDLGKWEVAAASCTTNTTFSSKSGMQWRSKASFVKKRKSSLQHDGKVCCQIQTHSNSLSARKWWNKSTLNYLRKQKLFSVIQVTDRNREGYYAHRSVCICRDSHSSEATLWKRLYLDKIRISNKLFVQQQCQRTGTNQSFD